MSKLLRKVMVFSAAVLLSLLAGTGQVFAQGKTISGHVTNDANQPVAGASVVVKGTTNGTTTDNNGNFSISASSGSTLVISSINFAEKEISIGGSNNYSVRLSSSILGDLGEVVVVG